MTKFEYLMREAMAKHEQCRKLLDESNLLQEQAESLTIKEGSEEYDENDSI